jgi:hypothetical protein
MRAIRLSNDPKFRSKEEPRNTRNEVHSDSFLRVRPVPLAGENAGRQSPFYVHVILCVSWFQLRFLG